MSTSPTQLTLKHLRSLGYLAEVTEHWNAWARRRVDLFGFVDVLGVGPEGTIAVQTTSSSNMAARVKKIAESENTAFLRKAGWEIQVWGWRKKAGKYVLRVVDCS